MSNVNKSLDQIVTMREELSRSAAAVQWLYAVQQWNQDEEDGLYPIPGSDFLSYAQEARTRLNIH